MITAGVVIDDWKLDIFKEILDAEGFEYTEGQGITPNTLLLSVKTESAAKLQPFIERAAVKAAKYKKNNPEKIPHEPNTSRH